MRRNGLDYKPVSMICDGESWHLMNDLKKGKFTWITVDGRKISVQDMDTDHLVNVIRMLEQELKKHLDVPLYITTKQLLDVKAMREELERRKHKKAPDRQERFNSLILEED